MFVLNKKKSSDTGWYVQWIEIPTTQSWIIYIVFIFAPQKKEKYNNSSNVFSVIRKATKDCIHKMAKNTSSSAFRKIDVDQYNEDNFKEDEADSVANTCDENLITNLLTEGKCIEALVSVLQNAPLRCKQQHVKVRPLDSNNIS